MKQIIHGRTLTTSEALAATSYYGFFGWFEGNTLPAIGPWSVAGTLQKWKINLSAPAGTGRTFTFTIQKNNVDTALVIVVADPATTGADLSNTVTLAPGDTVRIKLTHGGAGLAPQVVLTHYLEFVSDNARESGYNFSNGTPSSSWNAFPAQYRGLYSDLNSVWHSNTVNPDLYEELIPLSGEITRYDVVSRNTSGVALAPGAGVGWTLALYKNGVKQDGTGATVDTTCVLSDAETAESWSGSLPITKGDRVYLEATVIGTFVVAPLLTFGCRFKAVTDGQFMLGLRETTGGVTSTPRYNVVSSISSWNLTEASITGLSGPTTFYFVDLLTKFRASVGAGNSWTVLVRKNAATPAGTQYVTITDASTVSDAMVFALALSTAFVSGSISIVSGDTWGLQAQAGLALPPGICSGGGAITVVSDPPDGETFVGRELCIRARLTLAFDDADRHYGLDASNQPTRRVLGYVTRYADVTRQLSDKFSSYKVGSCVVDVDNTSRDFDALELAAGSQFWQNREGRLSLASAATIAAGGQEHDVFAGIWKGYSGRGLSRSITLVDILGSEFSDFNLEATIPKRLITRVDFPNVSDALVNTVVPIVYGRKSDLNVTVTIGISAGLLTLDASMTNVGSNWKMTSVGGGTLVYDQNTVPPSGGTAYVWIVPTRGGLGGPPLVSAYGTNYVTAAGWVFTTEPVGIAVHLSHVADETGYRVFVADAPDFDPYGGKGSATKVRYMDHDATTFDALYPGHDFSLTIPDWTWGADALGPGAPISVDTGTGAYSPKYVGVYPFEGAQRHTWVVAGHAPTDIEEAYVDGVAVGINADPGPWHIPGLNADPYTDINGHRYCLIRGKQGDINVERAAGLAVPAVPTVAGQTAPPRFAINLCGVEDVGNSTGSTITRAPRVVIHCLEQFGLQNYLTGLWSAPSTSNTGIPWLNTASFDALEDIEINRMGGEGYEAAMVIDEPITLREFLGRVQQNFGMRFGQNHHGQVIASHLNDFFDLTTAVEVTDVQEIIGDTDIDRRLEELENKVVYDCDYRPATKSFDTQGEEIQDNAAIANNRGKAAIGDRRQFYYTANPETALDVATRDLVLGKYPPRYCDLVCTAHAVRIKLNQIIKVTDVHGVGGNGWTLRPLWVLGIQTMLNSLSEPVEVKLSCLDVLPYFSEINVNVRSEGLRVTETLTAAGYAAAISESLHVRDTVTAVLALPTFLVSENVKLTDTVTAVRV